MNKDKLVALSGERLNRGSVTYIETLYEDYLNNPKSVSNYWREIFNKLKPYQFSSPSESTHSRVRNTLRKNAYDADSTLTTKQTTNQKQV